MQFFKAAACRLFLGYSILVSTQSHADGVETTLGGGVVTEPTGAALWATLGYSLKFWDGNNSKVLYGFLRPTLKVQTSILVNSYEVQLAVYPISFFGLGVGTSQSDRRISTREFDCTQVDCRGQVRRNFARSSLVLGASRFFLASEIRYEKISAPTGAKFLGDETSTLFGNPNSDESLKLQNFLGLRFTERNSLGAVYSMVQMRQTRQKSILEAGFYRFSKADVSLCVGAGSYRSSLIRRSPAAFLSFEYNFRPRIGFD